MYFKEFIRELRKSDNLTQLQLAELLGISLDAIKTIESAQTKYPSSKVLKSLATYKQITEEQCMAMILFDYNKEYNAVQIICDMADSFQNELYKYMQSFTTNRVRFPIIFVLYNGETGKIVDEHRITI